MSPGETLLHLAKGASRDARHKALPALEDPPKLRLGGEEDLISHISYLISYILYQFEDKRTSLVPKSEHFYPKAQSRSV